MTRSDNLTCRFVSNEVDEYLYELLPERDTVTREMEEYAAAHDVPIVGPAVARLLAFLVQTAGSKRIFEMGSAIGYSTVWLARAAGPGAEIFYTDGDENNARRAKSYFERAGVADRITVQTGDAVERLAATPGLFDFIFIDIDKHQYPAALRAALPRLRPGGLLAADNTLWSGKAAVEAAPGDRETLGIREFNRTVYSSSDLYPVIVPIRDGVTVCRKAAGRAA
jgi:predicted O-methyltransferase YrrM